MSYCRWSSQNFMCDVYVYEDCYGGWTTHVAGNRLAFPPLPPIPYGWYPNLGQKVDKATRKVVYPTRWRAVVGAVVYFVIGKWEALRSWMIHRIPRRQLPLPYAGERFNDATPGECADRLLEIREAGFIVPDSAIEALRAEQAELDTAAA